MGLYKWFFKRLTGIELVDPDPNFAQEENDAEKFLDSTDCWPKTVSGNFYLIDSTGDEEHSFHWVIGTLEIEGFKNEILLEFKEDILVETGLNQLELFPDEVTVKIDPAIKEYYQVVEYQKT